MSHFRVLVIGNGPETQLAPYQQFECTENVDEYVQSIDVKDEYHDEYLSFKRDKKIIIILYKIDYIFNSI